MSGICALVTFDGRPVDGHQWRAMTGALQGWGSPGEAAGDFHSSLARASLGARVLRITPEEEREQQPVRSRDGALTLVSDARLDNRAELAAALGLRLTSDTADGELILAAWERWGEDSAEHLIGDFAFAIWDERSQALHAVRDQLGQRALFYHRRPGGVALASTPRALLMLSDVTRRLDAGKLGELLVDIQNAETTCMSGIVRVPPAHVLRVSADGVRLRRYWQLDPQPQPVDVADQSYLEAFRAVFDGAVRDRLRSAHPVAATLSAGLDSSSVVGVAATELRRQNRRLAAWHAAPLGTTGTTREGWIADESDDVRAIAAMHPNVDLNIVRGPWGNLLEQAVSLFEVLFAPVRNVQNLGWYLGIHTAARNAGARVLLTGGKGNFTISPSGARWLSELVRCGRVLSAVRESRAFARASGRATLPLLSHLLVRPFAPRPLLRIHDALRGGRGGRSIIELTASPIHPDLARSLRLDERAADLGFDDTRPQRWNHNRIAGLTHTGDSYDVAHALRAWSGLETREPTTDLRVVEFCLNLPGAAFLRDGVDRRLVRDAMRDVLPARVLDRATRGAQAADWVNWFGLMRPEVGAELGALESIPLACECLDLPRLQRLVRDWPHQLGHEHFEEYGVRLMRGLMVGRFIRWFSETWAA